MPKVKTNRVKYPEGWELVEPTLRELQAKMREVRIQKILQKHAIHYHIKQIESTNLIIDLPADNDPHDWKMKMRSSVADTLKLHISRDRYVYGVPDFAKQKCPLCSFSRVFNTVEMINLGSQVQLTVKRPGYERLCCLRCIQPRDHNFQTTCVCRVPKHLREESVIEQDLVIYPDVNVVLSSTYVGKILGADQLLVILCYRYQESGIGYWILSMTINGAGVGLRRCEGREDVREVFQQRGSGAKRKLSRCGRNQMGNEPILALPEGADDFVVYYDARSKDLEACLEKGRRDVRTLAIEEAYTKKYSIHPGVDTMLCGFRLTNRWLSMNKDIASCDSKYLTYPEEEVEYQGSSGLLLQPELPE
ncbi:protein BUD31 homolog 2 [Tanacetum coccineum]